MSVTQKIICACGCKREKLVRVADIKRGWGRFYSKSCKARGEHKLRPKISKPLPLSVPDWMFDDNDYGSGAQSGYFGHGQD